jgi:hypothetical protein
MKLRIMDSKLQKNIQQYIQLVYSEKSELNSIADLEERKRQACEKAKLDYKQEAVQAIIHMKDLVVNEQIFEHLRIQNPNDFILLISDQHLFWEIMQRQMEPLVVSEDKDTVLKDLDLKTKMSEKAQDLLDRIKERIKVVFAGEGEQRIAEQKIRLMRPEDRLRDKKSA